MTRVVRVLPSVLFLGLIVAPTRFAFAQTRPNLSGTWVLVGAESDFGPMGAPQSRIDVIAHQGSSIVIKRDQKGGPNGDMSGTITYGVDGKLYHNSLGGNDATSTLRWEGSVLVIQSTVTTPQGNVSLIERWTLSPNGKRLTQDRALTFEGQTATQKIVLTRQ